MTLPQSDCEPAAMAAVNVFVGSCSLPPFSAGVLASEVYKLLKDTDGAGILVGPNGMVIVNENSPVPAGNYTYRVRSSAVVPQEGVPPSKRPRHGIQLDAILASHEYFEELLKPPTKLPVTAKELKDFLCGRPVKLPLRSPETLKLVHNEALVQYDTSEAASELSHFVEYSMEMMERSRPDNEASSSSQLCHLTGDFICFLNHRAASVSKLRNLHFRLDSSNPRTSQLASQQLSRMLRPDFQLFVQDCLIFRWENKIDSADRAKAAHENTAKLKKWSPLFYDRLPYVIGGCCAGRQFQWLKLYPRDGDIDFDFISDIYDLNLPCDVAGFLHSTIRLHCLLQKLQEELGDSIRVPLYKPLIRDGGGLLTFYPDVVIKEIPRLDEARLLVIESLYGLIAKSMYVIQGKILRTTRAKTVLELQPVGDPLSEPDTLNDLENATHDILHGLKDLHEAGYTHRDLRWPNFIKVNNRSVMKWVIIDLEAAGPDKEEWATADLTDWDAGTLEEGKEKRKVYTKRSDIYQLGKLVVEWLDRAPAGSKKERERMRSWGKQMQQKLTSAAKMLMKICKKDCKRCRDLGTKV